MLLLNQIIPFYINVCFAFAQMHTDICKHTSMHRYTQTRGVINLVA